MGRVTKGTSSRDRQASRSDKRSTQRKAQSLCKPYKFDAKAVSSWQPVSQSLVTITLQIIEENIRKTKDSMPRQHYKKVNQPLAHFYLRAAEKLKRLKAPKGKTNLNVNKNQLHEELEAAKNNLAEANKIFEDWSRSCEEIKAKAAELNEMCRSKSFDVQRLIPAIKVNDDPRQIEQKLQESHLAFYNGLPSYVVINTNQ